MSLFDSGSMAEGYARRRPPVHPLVMEKARALLELTGPVHCAVDVGCGAGLSAVAAQALARQVVGVEPVQAMLRNALAGPRYVCATAEQLPLRSRSAQLATAAGSLNFVRDFECSLAEIARVLVPGAPLVVYDFEQGRVDDWLARFHRKYPVPKGSARPLSPGRLGRNAAPFRLFAHEEFDLPLILDPGFYVEYMMTETNVSAAIAGGTAPDEIRNWCEAELSAVFSGKPRTVMFAGYVACLI